jgi:2-dehydropantoate 2-reductase
LLRSHRQPVTLILKDEPTLGIYRDAGAVQVERNGTTSISNCDAILAMDLPSEFQPDEPAVLLITTKAYDTVTAMVSLGERLNQYAAIIVMQNGMGTLEQIDAALPGLPVYVGITAQGAYRTAPFHIVHAGEGPTWIGSMEHRGQGASSHGIKELISLDADIGWDDAILLRMWKKLAVNCVINGLTVILDCRNGEVASEKHLPRVTRLCTEIEVVMAALLPDHQDFHLVDEVTRVANATSRNVSSMRQDVRRRRKTEIDYINGYLVRAAQGLQIAIPENVRLFEELQGAVSEVHSRSGANQLDHPS